MLISSLSPGRCNFPLPWLWLIAYVQFLSKKHLEEATACPAPWHLLIFIHLLYLQVILGAPWDWRPFRQGWWLDAFSGKKVRLLWVTFLVGELQVCVLPFICPVWRDCCTHWTPSASELPSLFALAFVFRQSSGSVGRNCWKQWCQSLLLCGWDNCYWNNQGKTLENFNPVPSPAASWGCHQPLALSLQLSTGLLPCARRTMLLGFLGKSSQPPQLRAQSSRAIPCWPAQTPQLQGQGAAVGFKGKEVLQMLHKGLCSSCQKYGNLEGPEGGVVCSVEIPAGAAGSSWAIPEDIQGLFGAVKCLKFLHCHSRIQSNWDTDNFYGFSKCNFVWSWHK